MVPMVAPFGGAFARCGAREAGESTMGDAWVEVEFDRVLNDSDHLDAVLFDVGGDSVWIPRSCLRDGEYDLCSKSDGGTFEIPENLAMRKDLI